MKQAADFALRLAFFGAAPYALVFIAQLFPIVGALLQIGLALLVFFLAERVRRWSVHAPVLSRVLANDLKFEAFYREHPPRPFMQYVLSPLFMWSWLFTPRGRRELYLYKGYTSPTFAFLAITLVVRYFIDFPPQLGFREFWPLALGTFGMETAAVLMFLMPLVTSVVHMHQTHAPRRLSVLLLAAMISVGFAVARVEHRRNPIVSYATRTRVRLRHEAQPQAARKAAVQALLRAWPLLPANRTEIDPDGRVDGVPLDVAQAELARFYKHDEAFAFNMWLSRSRAARVLVIFFPTHRGRQPIWTAIDRQGHVISDPSLLKPGLQRAMGLDKLRAAQSGQPAPP